MLYSLQISNRRDFLLQISNAHGDQKSKSSGNVLIKSAVLLLEIHGLKLVISLKSPPHPRSGTISVSP